MNLLSQDDNWVGDRNGVAPLQPPRRFVVSNQLPVKVRRDAASGDLLFELDEDRLIVHVREGLEEGAEVVHVGTLPSDVAVGEAERDDVVSRLYSELRCVPVFLDAKTHALFYHGFCKHYLWPLFHDMLPVSPSARARFERAQWRAYLAANKAFFDAIMAVAELSLDDDYFWIQDYHLMALPTRLRRKSPRVRLGFFLHSPFPTSEIYTTIPVRDEILRGLLNCDLVGFHTFDYARHFLSCCSRMFGLNYQSKRGYIELECHGRTVCVKILPAGIHMGRLRSVLSQPETGEIAKELKEKFRGKFIMLGVDDMDMFKGIGMKFLAVGRLLEENRDLVGKAVLIQIANPARSKGRDIQDVRDETHSIAAEVNRRFGNEKTGYKPIELITWPISTSMKAAFYSIADCCVVNATRDGMNLVPYKYTVCREHCSVKESVLIVSEFVGCSPSLSGALRVNPWDVDDVAEAMGVAAGLPAAEKRLRHESHYNYINSHNVAYWARSFDRDLERACRDHCTKRYVTVGLWPATRVIGVGHGFRELSLDHIARPYKSSTCRLILLDYDGTIKPHSSVNKAPGEDAVAVLNLLCEDPKNVVFIVSGRGRDSLDEWFSRCEKLGIASEHGFFTRWNKEEPWETCSSAVDLDWMKMTLPVMEHYTEATDGSFVEKKESALVWHHQDADPQFASFQAKDLLDNLESVLANEPVVVKRGHQIVEVQPQGMSKGTFVQSLVSTMKRNGRTPDFVLCIGDDNSDEDMFETISRISPASGSSTSGTGVFACTVGQKPTAAKYYLDDTGQVLGLLKGLASPPSHEHPKSNGHTFERVLLESY